IMGVYPPKIVARMKAKGIRWLANVTTVAEAHEAAAAGADVIVAQGLDAVGDRVPVVATGGIADARGIAAALLLGASAVQSGTGLLRTPEANLAPAWADAIGT